MNEESTSIISTGTPLSTYTDPNERIITLWLYGRSEHTQRAYMADLALFFQVVGQKPLEEITLDDVHGFALSQQEYSSETQRRRIYTVKSLISYAHNLGTIPYNVGRALRVPSSKDTLAERILSESAVISMIALETSERDKLIIRLFYASGVRVSELCALKWRDVQSNGDSGQVTVLGKGGKTRAIKLDKGTWSMLLSYRNARSDNDSVFVSRKKHGHLSTDRVREIVKEAAKRIDLGKVSPHWLRHSHASHALDRGAKLPLVRDTLGHSSIQTTGRYLHAKPDESSGLYLGLS